MRWTMVIGGRVNAGWPDIQDARGSASRRQRTSIPLRSLAPRPGLPGRLRSRVDGAESGELPVEGRRVAPGKPDGRRDQQRVRAQGHARLVRRGTEANRRRRARACMGNIHDLADGHHVDEPGNPICWTYVDLRPAVRCLTVGALKRAWSKRRAVPGCETVRLSKPSCFRAQAVRAHRGRERWAGREQRQCSGLLCLQRARDFGTTGRLAGSDARRTGLRLSHPQAAGVRAGAWRHGARARSAARAARCSCAAPSVTRRCTRLTGSRRAIQGRLSTPRTRAAAAWWVLGR